MEEKTTVDNKRREEKARAIGKLIGAVAVFFIEAALFAFLWNRYSSEVFNLDKATYLQAVATMVIVRGIRRA